MAVMEASSSAPRPLRFSRKCPPPGMSQPKATAGNHVPMGGMGCFCCSSFSLTIFGFLLSLAASPSGLHAGEVGKVVDAAGSRVAGHLRIGAKRPAAHYFAVGEFVGADGLRRLAALHPFAERPGGIELVGAGAIAAVEHAGHHEEPEEVGGAGTHPRLDSFVILQPHHGVQGRVDRKSVV